MPKYTLKNVLILIWNIVKHILCLRTIPINQKKYANARTHTNLNYNNNNNN